MIDHKIEKLIEEAFRLDTPEKIATFKRRVNKPRTGDVIRDTAPGAVSTGGALGTLGGAVTSLGGALPMSAVGLANPLVHAAASGVTGGLAGAAAAALPIATAVGYKSLKNRIISNKINKKIHNSINRDNNK